MSACLGWRRKMWIVKLALNRPYTFIVAAILILILGFTSIATTSTDVFPNIDIPVITVIWNYSGLPANEMEQRITSCILTLPCPRSHGGTAPQIDNGTGKFTLPKGNLKCGVLDWHQDGLEDSTHHSSRGFLSNCAILGHISP